MKSINDLLDRKVTPRPSIPTLNLLIGDRSCNMACKYCVSKMTTAEPVAQGVSGLWYKNKELAFNVAKKYNTDTVLITGKGEPTLWKMQTLIAIADARRYGYITELQTNGVLLDGDWCDLLADAGLNTLAISRAAVYAEENDALCQPAGKNKSPSLLGVVPTAINRGINVRLCFLAMKDRFSIPQEIVDLCELALDMGVKQVTLRRMGMPTILQTDTSVEGCEIRTFVEENAISDGMWANIIDVLMKKYPVLRVYDWGSISWAVGGVQLLLADCLTVPGLEGTLRYFIYCPDGHLRFSWEHDCSIIF